MSTIHNASQDSDSSDNEGEGDIIFSHEEAAASYCTAHVAARPIIPPSHPDINVIPPDMLATAVDANDVNAHLGFFPDSREYNPSAQFHTVVAALFPL